MLTEQYRMHAQIMGFSSEQFYGGQLKPHHTVRRADLGARLISGKGTPFCTSNISVIAISCQRPTTYR